MDINKRSHVPYWSISSRGPSIINEGDKRSYYQISKIIIKSWFMINNFNFCLILLFNYIFIHFLAILKIDGKVATQDKMNCITKCSKAIFHMLKISNQGLRPISADDFFPTLVFVCIKANPPRIQSNLNFVRRFANDNKLSMGEGGYLFVNIVRFELLRYNV